MTITYKEQAETIALELQGELRSILGQGFELKVGVSTLGGDKETSLLVAFYGKDPAYGIAHNSPTHTHIWMHAPFSRGPVWECDHRPRALKFRKISAPTIEEANQKLVVWFAKVKPILEELERAKKA